jgi:hypothetical protein
VCQARRCSATPHATDRAEVAHRSPLTAALSSSWIACRLLARPAELLSCGRVSRVGSCVDGSGLARLFSPRVISLRPFVSLSEGGQERASQLAAILFAQSERVPVASGKLPISQCAWACSSAVKMPAVIDRAAVNARAWSQSCVGGT